MCAGLLLMGAAAFLISKQPVPGACRELPEGWPFEPAGMDRQAALGWLVFCASAVDAGCLSSSWAAVALVVLLNAVLACLIAGGAGK